MQSQHFPLNSRFKPSTAMMTWYRAGISLVIGLLLLFSYVPAVLFGEMPPIFSVLILGSTALIFYPVVDLGRYVLREHVLRTAR